MGNAIPPAKEIYMATIKRIVLDVLKPHSPNVVEFAQRIAEKNAGCRVQITVSEMAERKRELRELERAMVTNLGQSVHATAARLVPVLIALVNGLAPFLIAMLVTTPLWLEQAGIVMPFGAVRSAIATAFVVIFLMGILLGRISGTFWLWSALRTLAIAALTGALILPFAQ